MNNENPSIHSLEDYSRVYGYSLKSPEAFWASVAEYKIKWRRTWDRVSDCDYKKGIVNWYLGAELNVSENCLDRHIESGLGDSPALIWVGNDLHEERVFSFRQLLVEVSQVSRALERSGIRKGDRVVLYLPNIPELAIAILACARIGAIHSVIFGGFSAHSIQDRVNDCQAKLILTANGVYRGDKWIALKSTIDEAMGRGCPTVERVVVFNRHPAKEYLKGPLDVDWKGWVDLSDSTVHLAPTHSAQDPLFILYTSGSTGKPKGVVHAMGGYLTYVAYSHEIVFQPQRGDVFWCTADLGWITGHSYLIYGPLANGVTTLMYEGVPTYPDPSRFWRIVERWKVSLFYTAPTAIRILASAGNEFVKKHSTKSIRTLGTVGEPINPEAWKWYHQEVGGGRAPIVDTWWQTETGGVLISPLAGISPIQAGSASLPLPGIEPHLLDEAGQKVIGAGSGALVISRSWPGQMTGVYGDLDRFYQTYFSHYENFYFTGDGARRDEDGLYWITGRTDDVIKVSGHRLGSAEIESACAIHSEVVEAGAVGIPDPITGEALYLFVVLKPTEKSPEEISKELVQIVRKEVGPLAHPKEFVYVPALPKTRSGKVMRRILRKIASGEVSHLGDLSTLADPSVVEKIIACVSA